MNCTCMKEDGRIATPSGSCPEHRWMVDRKITTPVVFLTMQATGSAYFFGENGFLMVAPLLVSGEPHWDGAYEVGVDVDQQMMDAHQYIRNALSQAHLGLARLT